MDSDRRSDPSASLQPPPPWLSFTPSPGPVVLDWLDLESWARIDKGRAEATVAKRMSRIRYMTKTGFDWERFAVSPEAGEQEARRWLRWKSADGSPWAIREYQKALNWVVDYIVDVQRRIDWRGVHWDLVKEPRTIGPAYSEADLGVLRAYTHPIESVRKRRRAILWLCEATGLRRSEIASLRVQDVDLPNLRLYIHRPAKGGKRRWVPIGSEASHPKRPLVAWLRFRESITVGGLDALWVSIQRGSPVPMKVHGIKQDFWRIRVETGVPVSFNRFRHTRARALTRDGVNLRILQELYGHQSPASTARYAQVDDDAMRAELERLKIPGYIRRRPGPKSAGVDSEQS